MPVSASTSRSFSRFFVPSMRANPYPLLADLREQSPFLTNGNTAVIARYADCEKVLRSRSASSDYRSILPTGMRSLEPYAFIYQDPPEHTLNRSMVSADFTRAAVVRWREVIERIADESLWRVAHRGFLDVVEDFALPIPMRLAFQVLGIPARDHDAVRQWVYGLARTIDVFGLDQRHIADVIRLNAEFDRYLITLLRHRAHDPGDDVVSRLASGAEIDDPAVTHELAQTCKLLAIAGMETTVNLIGNTVLALCRHPEQLDAVRADPTLVEAAVEETLRHDPPFQIVYRHCTEPITLRGLQIPGETRLAVLIGATGRDPERHERPDDFDVFRLDKTHISFAAGPHFCLGAALARLEVGIALRHFVTRVSDPVLMSSKLRYRPHVMLRGLSALPVRFSSLR